MTTPPGPQNPAAPPPQPLLTAADLKKKQATPLTANDLREMSRARLEDAEILTGQGRYDGAIYLCGYAVELSFKARICQTLGWTEYKTTKGFESFKTHELEVLLDLSGLRAAVIQNHFAEWSYVDFWKPELIRYQPANRIAPQVAVDMVEATKILVGIL